MKKLLTLFSVLLLLLSAMPALAASAGGYEITDYDVTINVGIDNIYDVQEKITVNFSSPRHGIYRDIPVRGTLTRADGTRDRIRAKIEKISVIGEEFDVSRGSSEVSVKIGSADKTVIGSKVYHINYRYIAGKDNLKDADEFYYNIIGDRWDVPIKNISFVVNMPKPIDPGKVGFACGRIGTDTAEKLMGFAKEQQVYGNHPGLNIGEALTMRITLPEGYFLIPPDYTSLLSILFGIILCAICGGLWLLNGRDDKIVEVIGFEPPEGMNSLEMAFKYYGKVNSQNVTSLLISLANSGYLKIIDSEVGAEGIRFCKEREYDGDNEAERLFFNGLFRFGDEAKIKELQEHFPSLVSRIVTEQNCRENKDQIINRKSKHVQIIAGILVFIYAAAFFHVVGIIFAGLFVAFLAIFKILQKVVVQSSVGLIVKVMIIVRSLGSMIFAISGYSMLGEVVDKPLIGLIFIVGSMFFVTLMPQRTLYGTRIKGEIAGFKRFMETTEKHRFEELLKTDPKYFYKLLPYAYVLGIHKKYMERFGGLVQPPDWYGGLNGYNRTFDFNSLSRITRAASLSSQPPVSHSSSRSSGGGFSGGGHGGGGGGSW